MQCCADTIANLLNSNCAKYKDTGNNVITGRVASEDLNPDLALAACPQKSTVCGNIAGWHFADNTATKETVTIAAGTLD